MRSALVFAVPALALSLAPVLAADAPLAGDAVRGERVFQRCYACHSVEPGESTGLQGPSLYGIFGRPAAAVRDFAYSDAMRRRSGQGLIWDAAALDAYVSDPDSVVPGTMMSIPPVRDPQDRADLIAYLARQSKPRD